MYCSPGSLSTPSTSAKYQPSTQSKPRLKLPDSSLEYIEQMVKENRRVEIRAHHVATDKWRTIWTEYPHRIQDIAERIGADTNLYTSLQRVSDINLTTPIGNAHPDRITRLFFDFDPIRSDGASSNGASSDGELRAAIDAAQEMRADLYAQGWPLPAIAMSGNGAHLQYRVSLEPCRETKLMLDALYIGFQRRYSNPSVSFDPTVRNFGRICALYGTRKIKGVPNCKDRPHRVSRISLPPNWGQVKSKNIRDKAVMFYKEIREFKKTANTCNSSRNMNAMGDFKTIDVAQWISSNNLYIRHMRDNLHYMRCPWENEHESPRKEAGGDTIIYDNYGDAWPTFYCHHSHCRDRTIKDLFNELQMTRAYCSKEFIAK